MGSRSLGSNNECHVGVDRQKIQGKWGMAGCKEHFKNKIINTHRAGEKKKNKYRKKG